MIPTSYPTREEIARLSARMLLEIGAVNFNAREPYTLASGLPSPHPHHLDGFSHRHRDAQRGL